MFKPTEMYIFHIISIPIDKLLMKSWSLDVGMLVASRYVWLKYTINLIEKFKLLV